LAGTSRNRDTKRITQSRKCIENIIIENVRLKSSCTKFQKDVYKGRRKWPSFWCQPVGRKQLRTSRAASSKELGTSRAGQQQGIRDK
jgi:hypothetical protein